MSVWTDHYPHANSPTFKIETPYVGHDHGPIKTLRDEFAMAALPSVVAKLGVSEKAAAAIASYDIADAMMAERSKREG
jgi:hypothetical protein